MSDELIEGHALRGQQPIPDEEPSKPPARARKGTPPDTEPPKTSTRVRKSAPPDDEPTGPYIILEPPVEAGDVLSRQSEMATFHKGLKPVIIEESESVSAQPAEPPAPEAAPSEGHNLAADLPWSVIESTSPDLLTRTKPDPQLGTRELSAEPPPDFLPHFHTPTGTFPPIKDDLLSAQKEESTLPVAEPGNLSVEPPPDFLPHFHTPTGTFPPIKDDLPPAQEEELALPAVEPEELSAGPSPDFLPHFHTPTGTFPPIKDDLPPAQEEESALPAVEPEELSVEPPPDFLPDYRTPAGVLPPIRDDLLLASEAEEDSLPLAAQPEVFSATPLPVQDLEQPVPITHFQEGLHPSQEIEDIAPPPVAPISDEPGEFIPLFHTPTSVLPHVPDEIPVLQESSASAVEEAGDEVVDAEWVVDVDRRLQRARSKMQATAHRAVTNDRRVKSHLLTALAVIVLTVLAILIPITIRFAASGAAMPPSGTAQTAGSPGSITPGGMNAPGVPLLLTPTVTTLPLYSHGRLAYSSNRDGDFEIYVLDMRNGQLARLTDDPAADRSPRWSPDGRQLVFVSNRSGNDDLYLVSGSRSEPVRLTQDPGSDRNPAWSPDGSRIVFSRETVDGSHLVTMPTSCLSQPDTCESQTSALTPGGYDLFPAWSPDGRWISFAAADFPGLPSTIALISPQGNNYSSLPGTGTSDFYPAWSPDGKRIAFVSYAQGDYDLWVMGADGQGLTQLTQSEATDVEPDWSPDGKYIVFASDRSAEGDFELYLIRSDCTPPQAVCEAALVQLTNDSSDDLNPDWTP